MNKIKIFDNFLEKELLNKIIDQLCSDKTPWFHSLVDVRTTTYGITKNKNGYFRHTFYVDDEPNLPLYDFFIKNNLVKKLNCSTLISARANLSLRDIDTIESSYHVDYKFKNSKTAILYLTTCNAKTVFQLEGKEIPVESVKNRLVVFDTDVKHKIIYQTDKHKRYVINFNYYEGS